MKKKIRKPTPKNGEKKNRKIKKGITTTLFSVILLGGIAFVSLILVFALYVIITSPDFEKDKLYSKESTVIYYADGTEMTRFGSEDRVLVNYDELPQVLVDAIVATEDSRFFQHSGLDIARFAKATVGQLLGQDHAGGGSTLTMQVAKKTYNDENAKSGIKGLIRKAKDIYMSVFKIESNYTKEEIIEFYVNSFYFVSDGSLNHGGIAGVEQASQYYFGKSVSDLTLAEASIMAGMFQNPNKHNPYTKPENVRKRQNTVLTLMVNHGYITEEEKQAVLDIPVESLVKDRSKSNSSSINQAVVYYVLADVEEKTGLKPYDTPMKIYTTIKPDVQNVLNRLERGELYDFPNDVLQEGIAVTSTDNGAIVALSGGRNYMAKGNNRATVRRQPGSTAKILFDYGPYLETFSGSSPGNLFLDEPTTYSNGTPIKNADNSYLGLITMRTALVKSRNIPALRAFKAVANEDIKIIENFVHSLGIDYGDELFESASIGGFMGISPIEMSAAYAAFGRGGFYIEPYCYTKIEILETGEIKEHKYEKVKVMSEETAYMITDMLMSAAQNGVGGVKISGTDIAAKSGTSTIDSASTKILGIPSHATMDSWNVTYSPEYAIALWIGYDKTTSEYYLTSKIAGPIRLAIMKAIGQKIYSTNQKFEIPSGIVSVEIENETFPPQLASDYTPSDLRSTELFKTGTEPTEVSIRFSKLNAPSNGSYDFNGTNLTLNWRGIDTPDAISQNYLSDHFNTYYDEHASKYYEKRISYNNTYIGSLGYNIYQKDASGNLTYVGRTNSTSYTISNVSSNATYVIKSSYSTFSSNMSDGLEIKVTASVDNNVGDMLGKPNNNNNNNGNNNNNNNNNSNDHTNELD